MSNCINYTIRFNYKYTNCKRCYTCTYILHIYTCKNMYTYIVMPYFTILASMRVLFWVSAAIITIRRIRTWVMWVNLVWQLHVIHDLSTYKETRPQPTNNMS